MVGRNNRGRRGRDERDGVVVSSMGGTRARTYSSILRGIASRFQNFTSKLEDKLPRVNVSRFQSGATCTHIVKSKRVTMQPWRNASRSPRSA